MGRKKQDQPKRINEKLRSIRLKLGLSQEEMYNALREADVSIHPGYVSLYEIGERIPSLLITLAFARLVNIPMEILVDDKLELPEKLKRQYTKN